MTNEEIQVCLQLSQQKYVKLEILNQNDYIVDELSGVCESGNYSIDSDSSIRRTSNLTFVLSKKVVINKSSPLWINKRFRLWLGVLNLLTGNVVYMSQGIYIISDPKINISVNDYTVSISGIDKMCYLDNTASGQLGYKTIINDDTPISNAVVATMGLSGETKLLIDTTTNVVPYDIEKEATGTIYDIIDTLGKLYMDWKYYYDINGNFVFTKIRNHINDPIMFDFSLYPQAIINISQNINYSNIKNYIKIIGKLLDNGIQYTSEINVNDATYPNNPFTIEKMGELKPRKLIIQDDNYFTQEQCDTKAEYEYELHSGTADTISITTIPLLFLDVDMIIYVNYSDSNIIIEGKYCITKIDCGVKYSDTMTIQAYKVYM